jgi:O-antigen ligase
VAGAAVASLLTILRYAQGHQTYYRRYAAAGFDPNDLGLTVALAIPLALYLALKEPGLLRWAYWSCVALALTAVLLSASRTCLVVSFAAFSFVVWSWRESDSRQKLAGVALAGLLLGGVLLLAPPAARQRLGTLPTEAAKGTLHDRTRIWKAGAGSFRSHPLLGVGAGAFPEAVRPQIGEPALAGHRYVAHNSFLSILVECGLIGLGLFLLLAATLAAFIWMMPVVERALWSVMLAAWALGVMTLTWEHRKPTWLLFALIMTEWARSFAAARETR